MMKGYSKHKAVVKLSDPVAVQAKCSTLGWVYENGAIFIQIPEAGLEGTDLIYCRYGLSIPYMRVQDGWYVWVEPTITKGNRSERWIYTGIADAGEETVDTTIQMAMTLASAVMFVKTTGNIYFTNASATEAFVLGTQLKTKLEALIDAIVALTVTCAAPGAPSSPPINSATFTTLKGQLSAILSTKIFGA